jgi:hypothetical protein
MSLSALTIQNNFKFKLEASNDHLITEISDTVDALLPEFESTRNFSYEGYNFRNYGNTCFVSSAIQLIMPLLDPSAADLGVELTELLAALKATSLSTENAYSKFLKHIIPVTGLSIGRQEDAAEFLGNLYPEAKLPYNVLSTEMITCASCLKDHYTSQSEASAMVLADWCKNSLSWNLLGNDREPSFCDNCNANEYHNSNLFLSARDGAKAFLLQIKRFWSEGGKDSVPFSSGKHLSPVVISELMSGFTGGENFEVLGFIVHLGGTIEGGHYVTYIRSVPDRNLWILFDDIATSTVPSTTRSPPINDGYIYLLAHNEFEPEGPRVPSPVPPLPTARTLAPLNLCSSDSSSSESSTEADSDDEFSPTTYSVKSLPTRTYNADPIRKDVSIENIRAMMTFYKPVDKLEARTCARVISYDPQLVPDNTHPVLLLGDAPILKQLTVSYDVDSVLLNTKVFIILILKKLSLKPGTVFQLFCFFDIKSALIKNNHISWKVEGINQPLHRIPNFRLGRIGQVKKYYCLPIERVN